MVIRAVGTIADISEDGSGKFGVAGAFKLPRSSLGGGPGATNGVGADLSVVIIVNHVRMAMAELEGDAPIA